MAGHDGERWVIRDAPPALFHVLGANTLLHRRRTEELKGPRGRNMLDGMWSDDLKTMSHDRRELLAHFQRAGHRIQGGGRGQRRHTLHGRCCSSTR